MGKGTELGVWPPHKREAKLEAEYSKWELKKLLGQTIPLLFFYGGGFWWARVLEIKPRAIYV